MKEKIRKNSSKILNIVALCIIICFLLLIYKNNNDFISTNAQLLSNTKIGWGIKRANNHEQPDLGSLNRKVLEQHNGIAMGNDEKKYIYLTFDQGYEAGYTSKILETLNNNDVKATFFITAHYVNTQEELVKQMIYEGHIIGNQF